MANRIWISNNLNASVKGNYAHIINIIKSGSGVSF